MGQVCQAASREQAVPVEHWGVGTVLPVIDRGQYSA